MIAVVTGAGRGIGRGIALRLAREGWSVAAISRSPDELAETAQQAGRGVTPFPSDVSDPDAVREMVRSVEATLGPVDLLVNNAGVGGPLDSFWKTDPADWWRCQEVNLRGPMLCCREVVPGMMERRKGCIVNLASGAGCTPYPQMSAYVVSKTALIRFSEQLAMELAPYNIRVFPIRPGIVKTRMVEEARDRLPFVQKMLDDGIDVPPDAAAMLVVALASGKADALSGHLLSVGDDIDDLVRRAEEVRKNELYVLRSRKL